MHPFYQLGIDLGTTWTAASICRDGAAPESVALGTASAAVASVAFLAPDGTMLTGEPAQRRALTEPARVVREFKRRIGDSTPLVVGGRPVPAEVIAARFVARVIAEVAHREDGPPAAVVVTHPVEWGEHKKRSFAAALAAEDLQDLLFLTEPQAAAVAYASAQRVEPGRTVAVYDLGGGTFDAALVHKSADGTFALLGRPTGIERLGGVDFDDAVFAHVRDAVGAAWEELDPDDPAVQTAVAGLRRECTAAKETLSADTEVMIPVMLPGLHTVVRLGRAEFEDMIRPAIAETVEALRRAIASAGVEPADLDAVLLVGGSSRMPLVAQMVSAELGRPVSVDADPKAVVAAGAALAARSLTAPSADAPTPAPEHAGAQVSAAPASPPLEFDAAPGAEAAAVPRRHPRHAVVVGAAAAVAVVFGLSASVAMGFGPVASTAAQEPPAAAAAPPPVDPWTGDQLAVGTTDPGAQAGTPQAVTTIAGPRRVRAVAAVVRPVARNVSTGAAGARRPAPAVVAVPPAPAVRPPAAVRQPAEAPVRPPAATTTTAAPPPAVATTTKSTGTTTAGTSTTTAPATKTATTTATTPTTTTPTVTTPTTTTPTTTTTSAASPETDTEGSNGP